MDIDGAYNSKSITTSDYGEEVNEEKEIEMDQKTIGEQSRVFEEMKLLLKTQQEALKHNIQVLQTKATKVKKMNQITNTSECNSSREVHDNSDHNRGKNDSTNHDKRNKKHNEDTDSSSRQWSHSSAKSNREDVQICPICAAEFDDPKNPEALEIHVAGHWSVTE